jgi:protein-disulfide isomerase
MNRSLRVPASPPAIVLGPALVLFAAVLFAATACLGANQTGDDSPTGPVAKVSDRTIAREALMERAAPQLEQVEAQRLACETQAEQTRYSVLTNNVEALVREELVSLASAAAGLEKEVWLEQAKTSSVSAVTDEAIDGFFQQNQRLAAQRDQIAGQVRDYLADQQLYADLKEKYTVDVLLEPYRVKVAAEGPSKGPEQAPVTIVEFSDFQCPYCKQVLPAIEQATEKYGDKLRLVFRQFPLNSIHPQAQKAAEASLCAADQGKFWQLHDLMFEEQQALDVAALKDKAARLELDAEAFSQCLDSGRYEDKVRADVTAGTVAGVTGTPALFVNGRPLSGAVAFETLSEIIDQELAKR